MKYYLWVLGCSMNNSDAERIATVMDLLGYKKTEVEDEADITITVACSVRQKAIDRIYGKTKDWNKKRAKNKNFKTILSGCVLPHDRKKMSESFDLIFDISKMEELANFLSAEKSVSGLGGDYLSLVPTYESSFRAFVPIMTGCNNFCSYCAVPHTRGREKSRPANDIVKEIQNLVKGGCKEITLVGQNVNSYANNFGDLLQKIDSIPGDWRGYFYSNHPKDFSNELISVISDLKHFPHYIHLPLQSGNDEILQSMNRNYTKDEYLGLVKKIRKAMADVALTTDIIVGYPSEGEKEFADTIEVVKEAKFEMIFIGRYSPRLGTKSAKLTDDVPKEVKENREKILTSLVSENLEKVNANTVGQTIEVLVDEAKGSKYFARTKDYKVVEIKTDQSLELGQFVTVLIKKSSAWKLYGEIT